MRSLSTVTSVMCAETAACVMTVKEEKKVLKIAPHNCITEGVMIDMMKTHNCEIMTHT